VHPNRACIGTAESNLRPYSTPSRKSEPNTSDLIKKEKITGKPFLTRASCNEPTSEIGGESFLPCRTRLQFQISLDALTPDFLPGRVSTRFSGRHNHCIPYKRIGPKIHAASSIGGVPVGRKTIHRNALRCCPQRTKSYPRTTHNAVTK